MNNEPAFPTDEYYDQVIIGQYGGLTKLQWFAGRAMQGLLALSNPDFTVSKQNIAKISIAQAKELIKQLEKEK